MPSFALVSRADVGGRERLVTIAAIPWTPARMLAVPIRFVHVIVGGNTFPIKHKMNVKEGL